MKMKTNETKLYKVLDKTSGRSMLYVMTKKYDNMSNYVCYYTQNTKHSATITQVFLFLNCSYITNLR